MRVPVLPLASGLPAAMSATRETGARRPASLSFRRLSSSWRAQAATKEHWSYLPILNVMKGGGTVYEISPALSVFRAVVDMVRHRTGSLLVTQEGKIAGIVTERDILEKLPFGVGKSRSMTVSSIMTPADKLVTASPSFTLEKCIQTSTLRGIRTQRPCPPPLPFPSNLEGNRACLHFSPRFTRTCAQR